ncbi:MAG: hypothetical protein ACI9G1_000494 [Pirellulaceae bacterium]
MIDVVKRLVDEHPQLVNFPDRTPPPLHCAVLGNQIGMAEILLDNAAATGFSYLFAVDGYVSLCPMMRCAPWR